MEEIWFINRVSSNQIHVYRKQFIITVKGIDREFRFQASSEEDCQDWVETIGKSIAESKGFKLLLPAPKTKEFWRHDQLTEEEFLDKADTFDILLFKCNTASGKIIRTYTKCEFGKYQPNIIAHHKYV